MASTTTQDLMKERNKINQKIDQDKRIISKATPLDENLANALHLPSGREAASRYREQAAGAAKALPKDLQAFKDNTLALGKELIKESKTRDLSKQEEAILKNYMNYASPQEKVAAKQVLHKERQKAVEQKRSEMRKGNESDMARYDRAEKATKQKFVDGKISEQDYRERMEKLKELRAVTKNEDKRIEKAQKGGVEDKALKQFAGQIDSMTREVIQIRNQRKTIVKAFNSMDQEGQEAARNQIAKISERESALLKERKALLGKVEGIKTGDLKVVDRGSAYRASHRYATKAA